MKTSIQVTLPDEAEVTLTIVASVGTLKRLQKQLGDPDAAHHYPRTELESQIRDAIGKAHHAFQVQESAISKPD